MTCGFGREGVEGAGGLFEVMGEEVEGLREARLRGGSVFNL